MTTTADQTERWRPVPSCVTALWALARTTTEELNALLRWADVNEAFRLSDLEHEENL